jgi:hypothetical protein
VSELTLRRWPALHRLMSFGLALPFTFPAWCYDFPLSSRAIRDAYFLGTRQGVAGSKFLHEYAHTIAAERILFPVSASKHHLFTWPTTLAELSITPRKTP